MTACERATARCTDRTGATLPTAGRNTPGSRTIGCSPSTCRDLRLERGLALAVDDRRRAAQRGHVAAGQRAGRVGRPREAAQAEQVLVAVRVHEAVLVVSRVRLQLEEGAE